MAQKAAKHRWTQEEKDKFSEGVDMFGSDWSQITRYIGG